MKERGLKEGGLVEEHWAVAGTADIKRLLIGSAEIEPDSLSS